MTASLPPKPVALRLLNGTGQALRSLGLPLVRLDEESLLAQARKNTRLADFGDDFFRYQPRVDLVFCAPN